MSNPEKKETDVALSTDERLKDVAQTLAILLHSPTTDIDSDPRTEETLAKLVETLNGLSTPCDISVIESVTHKDLSLTPEEELKFNEFRSLVDKYARKYYGKSLTFEDLVQEGSIGLIKAIKGYNPELGESFLPYAITSIKGEILRAIRDKDRLIKPARSFFERDVFLDRIIDDLKKEGLTPTYEEVAKRANYDVKKVEKYMKALLDITFVVPDNAERVIGSEENYSDVENKMFVEQLLAVLSERERIVLQARAGLPPFDREHSEQEIAEIIRTSQVHVGRICAIALEKLYAYAQI